MTCQLTPIQFTDAQKGQICGILSVGCDRQTAADFVGCSIIDFTRAMQHNAAFSDSVRRAEAGAELHYMRNIQQAAKDEKNWRASVWWLERRSPERFARRPGSITDRQLSAFTATLVEIVIEEIHEPQDRERLTVRLTHVIGTLRHILYDAQMEGEPETDATVNADAIAHSGSKMPDDLALYEES